MELSQSDLNSYRRKYADSDLPQIYPTQTFWQHAWAITQKFLVALVLVLILAFLMAVSDYGTTV